MKNKKPTPQERLQAKKMLYEQEAMISQMRLQNNINYVKTDAVGAISNQISEVVERKNPRLSRLLKNILPKSKHRGTEIEQVREFDRHRPMTPPSAKDRILGLVTMVLPLVLSSFKSKLIFFGLRKSKKLLFMLIKKIFRLFF